MSQDYNSTLNLPKTDFPMRAGLPKSEPVTLDKWLSEKIYEKLMEKNEGKPLCVLHDGPPNANGDIQLGHALNKILKDFIKYIKQDKSIYTFKHLLNTNHLYSLVWFIIKNDETVKRSESFLRFASSVCVSMILESEEVGYAEGKEQAKALRDEISSYLQELDGQEELDELN